MLIKTRLHYYARIFCHVQTAYVFIILPRRFRLNIKLALAATFSNGIISMIMNRTPYRAPGISPQLAFP